MHMYTCTYTQFELFKRIQEKELLFYNSKKKKEEREGGEGKGGGLQYVIEFSNLVAKWFVIIIIIIIILMICNYYYCSFSFCYYSPLSPSPPRVSSEIVQQSSIDHRVLLIQKYIELCEQFILLNNFSR